MLNREILVLLSGGLDSAVLVASLARTSRVHPVYVSVGLAWETDEQRMLARLLTSPPYALNVAPLARLELTMRDVYPPTHWAITGHPPAYDTPDENVYLLGRNLVLLTKAGVMAASKRVDRIALGPLAGNPFPDARPAFFTAMGQALSLGLERPIDVVTPLAAMHKAAVIQLGAALAVPFELTLSCMNPQDGADLPRACGACSKCRERLEAFRAAGRPDPAIYRSTTRDI